MATERELFDVADGISDDRRRQQYLDEACRNDSALRHKLERMLAAQDKMANFLERSPWEVPADTRGGQQFDTVPAPAPDGEIRPATLEFLQPSKTPGRLGCLGHFDVGEVIGRGGMGLVLRAIDTKLNRQVAIKIMSPEVAMTDEARQRFWREAQLAASLRHDHIVTVHAVDDFAGRPYLVMEFVDGRTLTDFVKQPGSLAIGDVIRIGVQISAGLAAAHERGLIHRDIKPANILLEAGTNRVKITDFGLARVMGEGGLTQTGRVAGTPEYMSPEQAQGLAVDHRSDLFSLGTVLYSLCTGCSPFRAESTVATLRRVCDHGARPIRQFERSVPPGLVSIIQKLMRKDPTKRFQSAVEVEAALQRQLELLDQSGSDSPTEVFQTVAVRWRTMSFAKRAAAWMGVGLVLTMLILESSGMTQLSAVVLRFVRGGGTLVIEVYEPGVTVTVNGDLIEIGQAGQSTLSLQTGDYRVRFARDGTALKEEIVTIERRGRHVARLSWEPTTEAPKSHPGQSDAEIAIGPRPNVSVWSEPRRLSISHGFEVIYGRPTISSDGLVLLFESDTAGGSGELDLWQSTRGSINVDFSKPVNLGPTVNSTFNDSDPCLSVDGLSLWFASLRPGGDGGSDLWFTTRKSLDGAFEIARPVGPHVNSDANEGGPALSADGLTLLFTSSRPGGHGGRDLWMATRASLSDEFARPINLGPKVNSAHVDASPHLSTDGLELWFSSDRPGSMGARDLWVARRKSLTHDFDSPTNVGPSVNTADTEESPSLSHDGQLLLFESDRVFRVGGRGWENLWFARRLPASDSSIPIPHSSDP